MEVVGSISHSGLARLVDCSRLSLYQDKRLTRAYPGSEFVVANTLAKWKNLEPNIINFSQGFSQSSINKFFVFNSLPARSDFCCMLSADNLCKQFGPRSSPIKRLDLIWSQTV